MLQVFVYYPHNHCTFHLVYFEVNHKCCGFPNISQQSRHPSNSSVSLVKFLSKQFEFKIAANLNQCGKILTTNNTRKPHCCRKLTLVNSNKISSFHLATFSLCIQLSGKGVVNYLIKCNNYRCLRAIADTQCYIYFGLVLCYN